jgi:MFS family permease
MSNPAMKSKTGIKVGIWSVALLMMGVVGIASALSVIGAHFADATQTMIQNMVTIPCIVVIFTTLIVGKLMESISKKKITLFGILCFLIGGLAPMFLDNLTMILVFRGILGIGIGVTQVTTTAMVAENFDGEERAKVQGVLQACQMGGMCVMSLVGGVLANIGWNRSFLVYALGFVSLICLIALVPDKKPEKVSASGEQHRSHLTAASWGWTVLMFVNFISIMIYSAFLAYLMAEKGIGTAADSGISLALFAFAGIIVGVIYGKFAGAIKNKMIALSMLISAAAYLLLAFSTNVWTIHIGSFLVGWSLSMFMPPLFLNTGMSTDAWSAPMAISLVTSAQNLGQFVCPYIINPLAAVFSKGNNINQVAFILGAVLSLALSAIMFVWGIRKDRESPSVA